MALYVQAPAPQGALADRWPEWAAGGKRRADAALRRAVYEEAHRDQVLELIKIRQQDDQVRQQVQQFASRSPNLCKAVVDAVAVAYRRGCRRELRGASEAQQKAFTDIVRESGIERKASGLNARSWI